MNKGDRLDQNSRLLSSNGRFEAVVEQRGEFVLYAGDAVLWRTGTDRKSSMVDFNDGRLSVRDEDGAVVWTAESSGPGELLVCQDDGNLVMFDMSGKSVWKTNTIQSWGLLLGCK